MTNMTRSDSSSRSMVRKEWVREISDETDGGGRGMEGMDGQKEVGTDARSPGCAGELTGFCDDWSLD